MRNHLSIKQIADALGVRETYATQAVEPALDKVAKLVLVYGEPALMLLLERVAELREQREQDRFEAELPERVRRQVGGRKNCGL